MHSHEHQGKERCSSVAELEKSVFLELLMEKPCQESGKASTIGVSQLWLGFILLESLEPWNNITKTSQASQ